MGRDIIGTAGDVSPLTRVLQRLTLLIILNVLLLQAVVVPVLIGTTAAALADLPVPIPAAAPTPTTPVRASAVAEGLT